MYPCQKINNIYRKGVGLLHIIKDENGNVLSHAHEHEHTHTHTYEHGHEHGHEEEHDHCHGESGAHCHNHEGHSHCDGGQCHNHDGQAGNGNKNAALLKYMLDHNTHHAAELDQLAAKLSSDGQEKAAEQIHKAVDEFQKGNMYLSLAMSMLENQ